jgi:hypothetical protein
MLNQLLDMLITIVMFFGSLGVFFLALHLIGHLLNRFNK